jgi:hypothetical protein
VAGYLFGKDESKALDLKWKVALDYFRLPYFRMSSCAHNTKPFDHLSHDECIEAEKAMIALINEYATLGVAVTAMRLITKNLGLIGVGAFWLAMPIPIGTIVMEAVHSQISGKLDRFKRQTFLLGNK